MSQAAACPAMRLGGISGATTPPAGCYGFELGQRRVDGMLRHIKKPTFAELYVAETADGAARRLWLADFRADLISGLTVAIVALPLSMAIAIASGVTPERGLYTAVVGGFIVSPARRQPVPDRRTRRRLHRAGGADGRAPRRRWRHPCHHDGRRVPDRRRAAAARHLHQIHSLSGDRGVYRRHRRHHLREPAQGSPRHLAGRQGAGRIDPEAGRSLQSILTEHSPENLGKAGMFLDLKQSMRQALQGPLGGQIMSGLQPKVGSLGITREDLAKAIANPAARFAGGDELLNAAGATPAGTGATASSYWNIPKEGTPGWNAEVYEPALGGSVVMRRGDETTGGASHYDDFPRTGNIEDRRNEFLTTTERAALPPYGYYGGPPPEAAATPLSGALGLGDLPVPRGGATTAAARPQRAAGDDSTDNRFDEAFNAFQPSMQDFQSPANDYSMFQQPASRADLARVKMDFGGGFSSSPEPRQGGVGPQAELTPDFMDVIQEVESSGNPDKVKGSYKGLYQLDNAEFRKYGGTGSIFDPEQNTLAAGAKMVDENQRVQDILGRELSPVEQYMVHQQGVGGALAHLRNPDQPAWKSMLGTAEGRQKGEDWAKEAIWGNMTPEMKKQFGNVNNVTSRDFLSTWEDRYYGILNR